MVINFQSDLFHAFFRMYIMRKRIFYTEISYILGLLIMAFGAAFTEKADFGMSMVVAPAYILHLKVSEILPWFTFGVAEYIFQGILIIVTIIIVRKFKLSYLFSFVTAVIYGTLLDGAMILISSLPENTIVLRLLWYAIGIILCTFAVSLFFHTYISPEAYELIVKEVSFNFSLNINKVKTVYDYTSVVLAIVMSFAFFGFGVFRGIDIGTVFFAVVNGFLIGRFSKLLENHFDFKNKFKIQKYFE